MVQLKKKLGFVYEKAERELEEQILSGRLKAGDCVLSENALCATYGISRRSARTAIENQDFPSHHHISFPFRIFFLIGSVSPIVCNITAG